MAGNTFQKIKLGAK